MMLRRFYTTASAASAFDLSAVLRADLKTAMRNKAPMAERTLIRGLLSELKNLDIDNKGASDKFQIWQHLNKLSNQRESSASEYLKPGQPDRFKEMADNELAEAKIIKLYMDQLPVASKESIKQKVQALVDANGLQGKDKKEIFKVVPWAKVQDEWNASRSMISEVINSL